LDTDDAVGECLIAAIGKVLGDAATPPIVNAWIEAYDYLAHIFITTENDVRTAAAKVAGYDGFANMSVTKKIVDAAADVFVANGNNSREDGRQILDIRCVRQYRTRERGDLRRCTFSHRLSLGLTVHVEIALHGRVALEEEGVEGGDYLHTVSLQCGDGGGDDGFRFGR